MLWSKYTPIKDIWCNRINNKCKNAEIVIFENINVLNIGQYGNHINIDNVGGVQNFIRYFYEELEKLPLTCRCGKTHLGDNNICNHIELRNKNKLT